MRQLCHARAKALRLPVFRLEDRRWIIFPVICPLLSKATISAGMARRRLTKHVNNWPNNRLDELIPRASKSAASRTVKLKQRVHKHCLLFTARFSGLYTMVCVNSLSKDNDPSTPASATSRIETGCDQQCDPRALMASRSVGCEFFFIATSKRTGPGIRPSPAYSALRRGRVDRQRKALNRGQYRTGIIHILKFYRLDKLIYIVLWWEIGHVRVAQDRWPRV
jgi:hypothetical protein